MASIQDGRRDMNYRGDDGDDVDDDVDDDDDDDDNDDDE